MVVVGIGMIGGIVAGVIGIGGIVVIVVGGMTDGGRYISGGVAVK